MKKTPREHQSRGIEELARWFKANPSAKRRQILQIATGGGKTICGLELMRRANEKGHRALFLCDRRELVLQAYREAQEYGLSAGVVMAGYYPDLSWPSLFASKDTLLERGIRPRADLLVVDECVSGDSQIVTNVGRICIRDVHRLGATSVLSYNGTSECWRPITAFMPKGVRPVVEVVLASGAAIRCTPEHLLMTAAGWRRADSLTRESQVLSLARAGVANQSRAEIPEGDRELGQTDTGAELIVAKRTSGELFMTTWLPKLLRARAAVAPPSTLRLDLLSFSEGQTAQGDIQNISKDTTFVGLDGICRSASLKGKPFSAPSSATPRCLIRTRKASTRGCPAITACASRPGCGTRRRSCRGSRCTSTSTPTAGTEIGRFLCPPAACRRSASYTKSLIRTAKNGSTKLGSTKLAVLASPGGLATTDRLAEMDSTSTQKAIRRKRSRLSSIGLVESMAEPQSIAPRGSIASSTSLRQPERDFSPTSTGTFPSACNTNYDSVVYVRIVGSEEVFDISVSETHCFFANGALVHNCHRSLSDGWFSITDSYPDAYVVGLTATPARTDGRGFGDHFGNLVSPIRSSELIEKGLLVPTRCYAPEAVDKKGKRVRRKTEDMLGGVVSWWKRLAMGLATFCFASSIDHSMLIRDQFAEAGISCEHIDCETPDGQRDDILGRLRDGKLTVATSVGVLLEGIDVPNASCAILAYSTGSFVKYRQSSGRIQRPFPGKIEARLLDMAGNMFDYGFPDADVEWTLSTSDGEVMDKRVRRAMEEGKVDTPIICPRCFHSYSRSPRCPACGYRAPKKTKPVTGKNGVLTEQLRDCSPEQKGKFYQREWSGVLGMARYKGWTFRQAAAVFRQRCHVGPEQADVRPLPEPGLWGRTVAEVYPNYGKKPAKAPDNLFADYEVLEL